MSPWRRHDGIGIREIHDRITGRPRHELIQLIEGIARWALDEGQVFAVISHPSHGFVQLLCDDDDGLHLESSAGSHAIAANLGFVDLVPDFDFLAHGVLPPQWTGRDRR